MKTFTATDALGNKYRWGFWRDSRNPATWMLRDHEGYIRTLESNWIDSAARIRAILENYGLTAEVN